VETTISRKAGGVVFSPLDYPGIGPVRFFAENQKYLFLRTVGRKRHSDRPEVNFESADPTREFFFILDQSDEQVLGPLSASEFETRITQLVSDLNWKRPRPFWPVLVLGLVAVTFVVFISVSAFVLTRVKQKQE
jgi:hypothetical protein